MSIPTTVSWPEEFGIDPNSSTPDLLKGIAAKFEHFRTQFAKGFEEHQRQLPHLLDLMLSESWYPDIEMPISDTRQLENFAVACDLGPIEKYLIDYFRKSHDEIERRLCNAYPQRRGVLSEAFAANRNGKYALSIPVFLAQADGISAELLSKNFFISGKSIPEAEKLLNGGRISDYSRLLLTPLIRPGGVRAHTATLTGKTDFLNRHAVMHGLDLNYPTEKNALKCVSLLAYLLLVATVKS